MTFLEALQREMNFLTGGIQMPASKAGLKKFPARVTVSIAEAYDAETDAYGQVMRYSNNRGPGSYSGTGETLAEAVDMIRRSVEAKLSKNRDKEVLELLESLDKSL